MKKVLLLSTLVCTTFGVFTSTSATIKQWEVDYSGKPPYKRKLVEINVVDTAQMETADTKLVRSTDFSGKPPFKRNLEKLEIVDAAAMEATDADNRKTRTGRPPFKRH